MVYNCIKAPQLLKNNIFGNSGYFYFSYYQQPFDNHGHNYIYPCILIIASLYFPKEKNNSKSDLFLQIKKLSSGKITLFPTRNMQNP